MTNYVCHQSSSVVDSRFNLYVELPLLLIGARQDENPGGLQDHWTHGVNADYIHS